MKTVIDMENWERKNTYNYFKTFDEPSHLSCLNLDITSFLKAVKARKISFYHTFGWMLCKVMITHENFRYREKDGQVVLYDTLNIGLTEPCENHLFKIVRHKMNYDLDEFLKDAKIKIENTHDYFPFLKEKNAETNNIYGSCIPSVSFTFLTHCTDFGGEKGIPRVTWGKYFEEDGKILLPIAIQVHHGFIDGSHLGEFIIDFQDSLNKFE